MLFVPHTTAMSKGSGTSDTAERKETASWQEVVARKVESLRYGVVQVIVYDGQVVQIERTERIRIAAAKNPGAGRYQE